LQPLAAPLLDYAWIAGYPFHNPGKVRVADHPFGTDPTWTAAIGIDPVQLLRTQEDLDLSPCFARNASTASLTSCGLSSCMW